MSKEAMKLALEALDGEHVDRAYGYIQEALVNGEEHMTDTIVIPKRRRGERGLGKKPALICTSLRLPKEVMNYFKDHYPTNRQVKMREILTDFVKQQGESNGE